MCRTAYRIHFIVICCALFWAGQNAASQHTTKITAPDGAPLDQFGGAVSISGNYLIAGANKHDTDQENAGAAYIFQQLSGAWTLMRKLISPNGMTEDGFGVSVSIDGENAAIGAIGDDGRGRGAGAVYIFHLERATWAFQQKLTANNGAGNDGFGIAVSLKGDYLLVGARGDDDNGNSAGSAYLFRRDPLGWTQAQKLIPEEVEGGDFFGSAVSLSQTHAIIGAILDDDQGDGAGAAYVYRLGSGGLGQIGKLTASDGARADQFGGAVSIDSMYAVVGAAFQDQRGFEAGAAYVYRINENGFEEVDILLPKNGSSSDFFGHAVARNGALLLVSATGDDDTGADAGAVYVYMKENNLEGSEWQLASKLSPFSGDIGSNLGVTISISGSKIVAGSPGDSENGVDAGAIYVFDMQKFATGIPAEPISIDLDLKSHPNPFSNSTTIGYQVHENGYVAIELFDVVGRKVMVFAHAWQLAGNYQSIWDGRSADSGVLPAGLYFIVLRTKSGIHVSSIVKNM